MVTAITVTAPGDLVRYPVPGMGDRGVAPGMGDLIPSKSGRFFSWPLMEQSSPDPSPPYAPLDCYLSQEFCIRQKCFSSQLKYLRFKSMGLANWSQFPILFLVGCPRGPGIMTIPSICLSVRDEQDTSRPGSRPSPGALCQPLLPLALEI